MIENATRSHAVLTCITFSQASPHKGMDLRPCKRVSTSDHDKLVRAIDARMACERISHYPLLSNNQLPADITLSLEAQAT